MKNTALRANKETRKSQLIKFNGEEHERFYDEYSGGFVNMKKAA